MPSAYLLFSGRNTSSPRTIGTIRLGSEQFLGEGCSTGVPRLDESGALSYYVASGGNASLDKQTGDCLTATNELLLLRNVYFDNLSVTPGVS